jgi:penicillin amidase
VAERLVLRAAADVSPATPVPRGVRPKPARRWLLRFVLLTIGTLSLAVTGLWLLLRSTVPPLEGELTLTGLKTPVEILFDRYAIPHVYARDPDDAWMALGYLHGRERAWQMEVYRRATGGRLSEIFGPTTVRADRRFLALGLRRAASAEWQTATPVVRSALQRYADGVNASVAAMGRWRRPPEFQLLRLTPEPWSPVDSLAVARLMAWRLAENRRGELVRGRLAGAIGLAAANALMGPLLPGAPTVVQGAGRIEPAITRWLDVMATGPIARAELPAMPPGLEWLDITARAGGSNSWVIAGSRTATGRPLLANDPHLNVEMPSIWYEAHMVAAGLDVAGVTLPGTPFVIIGHNKRIAWGLTNTGADVVDFYVEDVDMSRRQYLYRGAWQPLTVSKFTIDIRGEHSEPYEVFSTIHGPLVATETAWEDPPEFANAAGRLRPRPLALHWEAAKQGETAGAFDALNRAGRWTEFLGAVRRFGAPSQNVVYADVDGHIGYAMSGRIPIRSGSDGGTPVPGWTGEFEWTGVVPPEQLPSVLDPPSGQIVAANSEIDRTWPRPMTRDWTAPFRTMRIVERLGTRRALTMDDMRSIQADVRAISADRLLSAVEAVAKSPKYAKADPETRNAIERLRLWDRQVDGRPIVALYQAFLRAMWRRTFADELPPDVFEDFFEYGLLERYVGLHAILDDPSSRWWNDIATVDKRENRDDIILLAAGDAMRMLRLKFGDEPGWSWDRLHALRFGHPLGAGGRILDWFFSRGPLAMVGDSTTVRKSTIDVRAPFVVTELSSYRQILDVGQWDRTLAVNTTGQSGNPQSAHYFDQGRLWQAGQYRPFPFSRKAVEQAKVSRLLLTP